MRILLKHRVVIILCFLLGILGCTPLIGPFSPTAYQNATSLKAEALTLINKANTPFADNVTQINAVQLKAEQAYEFVKGVPNNSISAKQWAILKDPKGDLLGKIFKRWQERGVLSDVLVQEYHQLISDAFDEIICLEANKKEATDCKV